MEELVWRKEGGERCEKSYVNQQKQEQQQPQTQKVSGGLPQEGGVGEALPQGGFGGLPPLNKRESASAKINERYLVGQSIQNPFMPNNNYANDLEVQMNFLTPQKGTQNY
jgi:hypothetical protein